MKKIHPTANREPHHLTKDAAEPVLHHHQEEETALAAWVRRLIEMGPRAWLLGLAVLAIALLLLTNLSGWLSRPSENSQAWTEAMFPPSVENAAQGTDGLPTSVQSLLAVADQYPNTAAARWALIRAGNVLYEEGLRDLPAQREVARPRLQKAVELYDRALLGAPAAAPEALAAATAKARALESRGDLDDAIAVYKRVAAQWPTSEQGAAASRRAEQLAQPDVRKFYEDLYTKDFNVAPAPGSAPSTGVPAPDVINPGFGTPLIPPLPPETPTPSKDAPATKDTEPPTVPTDPFAPGKAGDDAKSGDTK